MRGTGKKLQYHAASATRNKEKDITPHLLGEKGKKFTACTVGS